MRTDSISSLRTSRLASQVFRTLRVLDRKRVSRPILNWINDDPRSMHFRQTRHQRRLVTAHPAAWPKASRRTLSDRLRRSALAPRIRSTWRLPQHSLAASRCAAIRRAPCLADVVEDIGLGSCLGIPRSTPSRFFPARRRPRRVLIFADTAQDVSLRRPRTGQ